MLNLQPPFQISYKPDHISILKLYFECVIDAKPASTRNVDDIMKTIADWKSKTHLNKLDDDENSAESNIRSSSKLGSALNGSNSRLNLITNNNINSNGSGTKADSEAENGIEKYLNIVKEMKKKYSRSKTEVKLIFCMIFSSCF